MIGEQGVVLRFETRGQSYDQIERAIVAQLNRFQPGQSWQIDVECSAVGAVGADGEERVVYYRAEVAARRVIVSPAEPERGARPDDNMPRM